MAEANANVPPPQERGEKKKIGTLESVVNEALHGAKSVFKLGLAAAIPAAQATYVPKWLNNPLIARDTAIMASAQVAGDVTTDFKRGRKYTAGSALESAVVGTSVAVPLHYLFKVAHSIPLDSALGYVAKAGYWGGVAYPAYLGLYQMVNYLVRHRTFKGAGKYLKENYWSSLKKAWIRLLPISLLNVFFAPPILNIPIAAALTYFFTLFGAPKKDELKDEDKRDKTPYSVAAPNVAYKFARNSVKGMYDVAYALGSRFKELMYKSVPKPSAPMAPAPAQ